MQLESLNCNNCGAPLQVPETANFVTCNHCEAQLAIRRTESATFTEKLDRVAAKTDELAGQVAELVRDNRLAALERSWERQRKHYGVMAKDGSVQEPSVAAAVIGSASFTAIGGFMILGGIFGGAPAFFLLAGIGLMAFGMGFGMYSYDQAKEYRRAYRRYLTQRAEIVSQSTLDGAETSEQFLDRLEDIPTPSEYLRMME